MTWRSDSSLDAGRALRVWLIQRLPGRSLLPGRRTTTDLPAWTAAQRTIKEMSAYVYRGDTCMGFKGGWAVQADERS